MNARKLIEGEDDGDELKRELLQAVPGETFTIYVDHEEKEVSTIVLEARGRRYLWGEGETSEVVGPSKLSGVVMTSTAHEDRWFIFYIEDSFSPAMYAINAQSFEDAYAEFIDFKTDQLKIEVHEIEDYDEENLNYNSNGVPVDTESVQGFDAKLVAAY